MLILHNDILQQNGLRFLFSNKKGHCKGDMENDVYCVYPTEQPRCIDFYGLLISTTATEAFCVDKTPVEVGGRATHMPVTF